MHILIGLLGVGAVIFYLYRIQRAAEGAKLLVDASEEVRLAARRFGFRRKANTHPVEAIDDPEIAMAAGALAMFQLQGPATQDLLARAKSVFARHFKRSAQEGEELVTLGQWVIGQCGGAAPAITRASKRIYKLPGSDRRDDLHALIDEIAAGAQAEMSGHQREARHEINTILRTR